MRTVIVLLSISIATLTAQDGWPGPKPDGSTLLPNGWSLRPHGRQLPLASDLPIRLALHPSGRWLAVQHAGYREHEVVILKTSSERPVHRVPLPRTWSGCCFSSDGKRLFVSGGADDVIRVFAFDTETGKTGDAKSWPVGKPDRIDLPSGIAATRRHLWVPLQRGDAVVRLNLDTGSEDLRIPLPEGAFPFECLPHPGGKTVWVSLWGRAELRGFDQETGEPVSTVPAGAHPSEMVATADGKRLFVSNGNENTVTVVDTEQGRAEETIGSALFPLAPPGSTPDSVALSPNGKILLIANADNNNCAVIDVSTRGRSRSLGFIPLGAYPTSIRFSADGARVYAANGKGSGGSRRNPGGPRPESPRPLNLAEYTGSMFTGSLSVFEFPSPRRLCELSAIAYRCSPLRAASEVRGLDRRPPDSPIPARPGGPSPIRHCVYIIKENRTYDQVLGDDPRGNGDPALCLFPEKVTPNHHAIAREFVLLDNFYVESEVSADGHEWTVGAYASDFVERTWPVVYGKKDDAEQANGKVKALGYPSEGRYPMAFPKNRYLWDRARAAGISYRSYGEFVVNGKTPEEPGTAAVPELEGHFDPHFRSYDLDYPDVKRADRFIEELESFSLERTLPRLIILRLPNDHTYGTRAGKPTPRALVADNDLALGRVLEALSRSPFWKSMAVFVVEDDAQNGPDHVDAHRTVGLVAGPHVKRGAVISTLYSTCSMLRTMELILGLEPLSQFDAAARPMYDCFTATPDFTQYGVRPATWPRDEKNRETDYGTERSARFKLDREDAADDIELNEVIWKSIKGRSSPMPVPRRAAFVRVVDRD